MNLNDLANLGQIVGALAVVVSLIYVAHQIRQNTNAVRTATAQSVHEHFASWYHLLDSDESLSQVVIDGLKDYGSLSEKNKARFVATFMAYLSYSQNAAGNACPITLAGLGTGDNELRRSAGWQSVLERARLSFWRGIPSPRGRRPNETNATPRREANGRLQHRAARRIDVASSRC